MSHSIRSMHFLPLVFGAILAYATTGQAATCIAPDNGGGTANVPESCAYKGEDMSIISGLLPGDSIVLNMPLLTHHTNVTRASDATGGENVHFDTEMIPLSLTGTGSLSGFSRTFTIPVPVMWVYNSPRAPGAVQSFDSEVMQFFGQLGLGDPDFDLLRIAAGTGFGMPSPGHTTLTQLAGGNWSVDSFFDITYRIDFVGAPGGALNGRSGSTVGMSRFVSQQMEPVPIPAAVWLFGSGLLGLAGIARRKK